MKDIKEQGYMCVYTYTYISLLMPKICYLLCIQSTNISGMQVIALNTGLLRYGSYLKEMVLIQV